MDTLKFSRFSIQSHHYIICADLNFGIMVYTRPTALCLFERYEIERSNYLLCLRTTIMRECIYIKLLSHTETAKAECLVKR